MRGNFLDKEKSPDLVTSINACFHVLPHVKRFGSTYIVRRVKLNVVTTTPFSSEKL